MTSIGFIGVGEIASAMVEGLARSEADDAHASDLRFFLSPRNADRAKHLAEWGRCASC